MDHERSVVTNVETSSRKVEPEDICFIPLKLFQETITTNIGMFPYIVPIYHLFLAMYLSKFISLANA